MASLLPTGAHPKLPKPWSSWLGTGPPRGLESLGKLLWWAADPRTGAPRAPCYRLPEPPALASPSAVVLPAGLLQALLHQELLPTGVQDQKPHSHSSCSSLRTGTGGCSGPGGMLQRGFPEAGPAPLSRGSVTTPCTAIQSGGHPGRVRARQTDLHLHRSSWRSLPPRLPLPRSGWGW